MAYDSATAPERTATLADLDMLFRRRPLVWAQSVPGRDGLVAGFVTYNGEAWRGEVLIVDSCDGDGDGDGGGPESGLPVGVGYFGDREAAVRAVRAARPDGVAAAVA